MRDQLIGYLLDALEPSEQAEIEAQLRTDPGLKQELDLIARALTPLAIDRDPYEPPRGLAHRTCEFVAVQAQAIVAPPPAPRHWSLADLVISASIFFAATMLFFPALNQSRYAMKVTGCQNNLRQIGMALRDYSVAHNGYFPNIDLDHAMAAPGVYATKLMERGFISGPQLMVCPASPLAERIAEFRVPTSQELKEGRGQLVQMRIPLGGSYGYNLGYVANGEYQATKNLRRSTFALVADSPEMKPPYHSQNHGGCGQNVLFEDGHVQYLTTCRAHGCSDDIYVNDEGEIAPGLHVNDAVIAPNVVEPLPIRVHGEPLPHHGN